MYTIYNLIRLPFDDSQEQIAKLYGVNNFWSVKGRNHEKNSKTLSFSAPKHIKLFSKITNNNKRSRGL